MSTVKVGENESLESAIKRFKRKCQKDGIIGDIRKKEAYVKPSVKRKKSFCRFIKTLLYFSRKGRKTLFYFLAFCVW